MNALELYEAVYDTAREEYVPETCKDQIQDVIDYAFGAFGVNVSQELAEKIVDCRFEWCEQTWGESGNGNMTNNYYHCVQAVLEDIEL